MQWCANEKKIIGLRRIILFAMNSEGGAAKFWTQWKIFFSERNLQQRIRKEFASIATWNERWSENQLSLQRNIWKKCTSGSFFRPTWLDRNRHVFSNLATYQTSFQRSKNWEWWFSGYRLVTEGGSKKRQKTRKKTFIICARLALN